jgi:hypothetical protein
MLSNSGRPLPGTRPLHSASDARSSSPVCVSQRLWQWLACSWTVRKTVLFFYVEKKNASTVLVW